MTMMNNNPLHILNDSEINTLADIYLAFLEMNPDDVVYRRIKNAVILCALCYDDMECVYAELEKTDATAEQIASSISEAIDNLHESVEDMFNKAYCDDCGEFGFMPHHKTTDDIIAFLGKTFLYILETNYPLLLL